MKLRSPLWRVTHKLSEDFGIDSQDSALDYESVIFEKQILSKYIVKMIKVSNANFGTSENDLKQKNKYDTEFREVVNSSNTFTIIKDVDWKVTISERILSSSNESRVQELKKCYVVIAGYRNVYKYFLSELTKTELHSAEDIELEKMKQLAEQKLIAEGPLAIAQKEFEETLVAAQKEYDEMYAEILAELKKGSINIELKELKQQFDEKLRIQPFLQTFWDEVNPYITRFDLLKKSQIPNYVTNDYGKSVLESKGSAKSNFFKLINNLFVGNGKITRALNPNGDTSIASPQSQIKDFYNQLNAKYIPAPILDETGRTINTKEVDNNIFSNPELNVPKVYLEILYNLLEKLRMKYEEVLEERIKFEEAKKNEGVYLDIKDRNKTERYKITYCGKVYVDIKDRLKNERLRVVRGSDSSVSNLIQSEINKIDTIQKSLEKGLRVTKIR